MIEHNNKSKCPFRIGDLVHDLYHLSGQNNDLALVIDIHWGIASKDWFLSVLYQDTGRKGFCLRHEAFVLARSQEKTNEKTQRQIKKAFPDW